MKVKKDIPLPILLKKAQVVFNAWIRNRDAGLGCISCGSFNANQAGHYLSQGHNGAFRFNEINCSLQCIRCNHFLSGNLLGYREGLIKKYGEDAVKKLELAAKIMRVKKWSRFELELIIEQYKIKK